MKKLFLIPVLALALAGCSNDEAGVENSKKNVDINYMAINLVTTPSTRAAADDASYEDGTTAENKVSAVRFYFFDASNNAVAVRDGKSYYDWDGAYNDGGKDAPNVEKIISATLVIETEKGHSVPKSIVAVLNPTSDLKETAINNVQALSDYVSESFKYVQNQDFVMSNSVYAKGSTAVKAVSVEGHLYATADAAKNNPVNIYVERVLAKVNLKVDMATSGRANTYKTSTDSKYNYDGKEIYVEFLGWNTTATTKKSRAMKEINPLWNEKLFGSVELWNYAPFFRSFWAMNPTLTWTGDYTYGPFDTASDATAANAFTTFDGSVSTYVQENASGNYDSGADTEHPTQVIIAARLVDESGNAIEFANYAFTDMAVEDLPDAFAAASNVYIYENVQGGKYTRIDGTYIDLKTATEVGKADENTPGRYYVYAQLNETAAQGKTLVIGNAQGTTEGATKDDLNAELLKVGRAKVWKGGNTYYYFDIAHLGANDVAATAGKAGVVRNHVYKTVIKSLTGLGTPVFKPSETIYPEKPEDDEDTFIAADIRILSWRIVNQDVNLAW